MFFSFFVTFIFNSNNAKQTDKFIHDIANNKLPKIIRVILDSNGKV